MAVGYTMVGMEASIYDIIWVGRQASKLAVTWADIAASI